MTHILQTVHTNTGDNASKLDDIPFYLLSYIVYFSNVVVLLAHIVLWYIFNGVTITQVQ